MSEKNPFDQVYQVALYQNFSIGSAWVCQFFGEHDASAHSSDSVRVSEPIDVKFNALSKEDSVRNAVEALDAEEHRLRLQLQEKLDRIQAQRANLLALTHQPSEVKR